MADTRYEIRDKREVERRAWPVERLEVRAAGDSDSSPEIEGYAAVFGQLSVDLGGWRERIAPGAFARSVADNDVRALWDHNSQYVLGRNRAGTLDLAEDERGLGVNIRPPATTWAEDLLESMRRGDVNQMSFGFYVREDEWIDEDGMLVRVLRDVDLFDVSVVTYPAYPQTSAEARNKATSYELRVTSEDDAGEAAGDVEGERVRARARRAARQREIDILNGEMR
jgi:HK97 family phage prohead protease